MTINEFVEGLPDMRSPDGTTLKDAMLDSVKIWSNNACKGYCIEAMQTAGFERAQIAAVLDAMAACFDDMTEEQAEQVYHKF